MTVFYVKVSGDKHVNTCCIIKESVSNSIIVLLYNSGEYNDTRWYGGIIQILIVKAVAKDGIMVDINTFENSQKKQ